MLKCPTMDISTVFADGTLNVKDNEGCDSSLLNGLAEWRGSGGEGR